MSPARCGASTDASCCAAAAAAAASCGSMPFARNAPTMPVRTSPVPAVASDGRPSDDDEHARAGRGDERVGALEQRRRSRSAPPPRARDGEPVRGDLLRLAAEQPRELALVRREHARRRASRPARARRARRRRRPSAARPRRAARRTSSFGPVAAAEPRAERDRARLLRELEHDVGGAVGDDAAVVGQRPLHGLEQALLEHRQRRLGRGDGDVAGVGAHRRQRGERRRAGEPARAADDEHVARRVLVVALGRGAARGAGAPAPTRRCSVSACVEADVGDEHDAGVEAAGRDDEADLAAVERDGRVRAHRGAGDLAGRRIDAGRKVDREHARAGSR